MQKEHDLIIGTNKETTGKILWKSNNMMVIGSDEDEKNELIGFPLLNQVIDNKKQGVTIFDHFGNVAKMAYAMAKRNRRKVVYFDPILNEVKFNPLKGKEDKVITNFVTFFKTTNEGIPQFFIDIGEVVIVNALKVLKRTFGDKATMFELQDLVFNIQGKGRKFVTIYSRLAETDPLLAKEKEHICSWFLNEYFNEKSKTYEHCSPFRNTINLLLSNRILANVFNTQGNGYTELNFEQYIKNKEVVIINVNGLKLGGTYTPALTTLIAQSYQDAILAQEKPVNQFIYIKEMFLIKPVLHELLHYCQHQKLIILAETQNPLMLEYIDKKYADTSSLLASFPNILLAPGTHLKNESYFGNQVFSINEIVQLQTMGNRENEFFYRVLDRSVSGGVKGGVAFGIPLAKEDFDFLNKRIQRYENEFKKLSIIA